MIPKLLSLRHVAIRRLVNHTASRGRRGVSTDRTVQLPDGRTLGYAEYGLSSGTPLFYFHGFPSSRLELHGLEHKALRHRLRVIAADRPGFGLSSPQPHRRITEWPADVHSLAKDLGITRFAILGGSGGGPYALACAAALPRHLMSAVGIMASATPWEAGPNQPLPPNIPEMETYRRFMAFAVAYLPGPFRLLSDTVVGLARRIAETDRAKRYIDEWLDKGKGDEEAVISLTPQERREILLRGVFEAFAQGSAGMIHEAYLLSRHWGFDFEDIDYDGIQIWHGRKDQNAPIEGIRYMSSRLSNSKLVELDVDHYNVLKHLDEILENIKMRSTNSSV